MGYKLHANKSKPLIKILCLLISVFSMFTYFSFVFSAGDDNIAKITAVCDINGDSKITAADARLLLRIVANLDNIQETANAKKLNVKNFGDLNADSKITAADARILLRVASKMQDINDTLPLLFKKEDPDKEPPLIGKPDLPEDLKNLLVKNELLTPMQDHGLGKADMCQVVLDYAEAMPSGVEDAKSHPKFSPMLKGTYDYYEKDEYHGGVLHYVLKSGRKVAAFKKNDNNENFYHSKLLKDAYKMPTNEIQNMATIVSERSSDLYIKTKWLVPINVTFEPQKYYKGYESREWNLEEFEAEYMDIVFYYTDTASGSFKFTEDSVISKGEWIKDGDEKTILRLHFREKGGFYGYNIQLLESGYLNITLKQKSDSLTNKVVMIDPGHGGSDGGACPDGKVKEKTINLSVSQELKKELEKRGAKVVMLRESDSEGPTLLERSEMARKINPDVFVSVHCNSSTSSSAYGTEVFYFYPYAMPLAKTLQNNIVNAYKTKIYADEPEMKYIDRGHKFFPFYVARIENCPSVLIELGFMSNPTELAALTKADNQKILAIAIADGITDYLGEPKQVDDKPTEKPPIDEPATKPNGDNPPIEEPTTKPTDEKPIIDEPNEATTNANSNPIVVG